MRPIPASSAAVMTVGGGGDDAPPHPHPHQQQQQACPPLLAPVPEPLVQPQPRQPRSESQSQTFSTSPSTTTSQISEEEEGFRRGNPEGNGSGNVDTIAHPGANAGNQPSGSHSNFLGPPPKENATPSTTTATPTTPRGPRKPTRKLTSHQIFYIFILDGLGAMILSGAINFAIGYAMYAPGGGRNSSTTGSPPSPPILLFHLPNSLAGDAAVTIILQTVITWLVELVLVNRDLEKGGVAAIGFIPRPGTRNLSQGRAGLDSDVEKADGRGEAEGNGDAGQARTQRNQSRKWTRLIVWFCFLDRDKEMTEISEEKGPYGSWTWLSSLWSQILRALLVAVVMFFLLWGPFVGVLMALGRKDETIGARGDWVFDRRVWLPQLFKLILGGLLGLLETPAFAFFWMVKGGWAFEERMNTDMKTVDGTMNTLPVGLRTNITDEEGRGSNPQTRMQ